MLFFLRSFAKFCKILRVLPKFAEFLLNFGQIFSGFFQNAAFFLKIGKLLENGTVEFENSKKFASSQVQNFEFFNLNFEISKLLFATQVTFRKNNHPSRSPLEETSRRKYVDVGHHRVEKRKCSEIDQRRRHFEVRPFVDESYHHYGSKTTNEGGVNAVKLLRENEHKGGHEENHPPRHAPCSEPAETPNFA